MTEAETITSAKPTTSIAKPSRWLRFLGVALIFVLVFALVAYVVYRRWDAHTSVPTTTDITLYLVLMPLTLAGFAAWLLKRHFKNRDAASPKETQLPSLISLDDKNTALPYVPILAATLVSKVDAAEILDLAQNSKRAIEVDEELLNNDGFPIKSGRMTDLQISPLIEDFLQNFDMYHRSSEMELPEDLTPSLGRTLALTEKLLEKLLEQETLIKLIKEYQMLNLHEQIEIKPVPFLWNVSLENENTWPVLTRFVDYWFYKADALKAEIGAGQIPIEHQLLKSPQNMHEVPLAGFWDYLSRMYLQSQRQWPNMLLIAVDSLASEFIVDELASKGLLQSAEGAQKAEAITPSEAAAAIWVGAFKPMPIKTDAQKTAPPTPEENPGEPTVIAKYYHPIIQPHESKKKKARPDISALKACAEELSTRKMSQLEEIALILGDNGNLDREIAEISLFQTELTPDLDIVTGRVSLRQLIGDVGGAQDLMQLALGVEYITANQLPVLSVGMKDGSNRSIGLLLPWVST